MVKLVHSQIYSIPELEKDNPPDKIFSKVASSKLKIVVSNPDPVGVAAPSQETSSAKNSEAPSSFTVEVRMKGPYLYEMAIRDPFHYLKGDFMLEVEEARGEGGSGSVICHFPTLSDEALNGFVEEDETLYGMLMIQFQMQVLEQLLLFCATHCASTLIIFADDAQADALGVYRDFLTYKHQTLTRKGEKTEMVIPANREAFDAWIDFMEQVNRKFQRSLWHEQKANPVIRKYLKNSPFIG